jgi:hypothetical protein
MERETRQLIEKIKHHEEALKGLRCALERIQAKCDHNWLGPVFDPIIHPAYDEPEWKQGSDYRPACHVPERREPRWTRRCTKCGLTQITTESTEHVEKRLEPKWPTT